jgi:hypothetical protein
VSREITALTLREKSAIAITTAAATLALGVTLAALSGQLHAPSALPAMPETDAERVILVPIQPTNEAQPATQMDLARDDREDERNEHRARRRHRAREHGFMHDERDEDSDG